MSVVMGAAFAMNPTAEAQVFGERERMYPAVLDANARNGMIMRHMPYPGRLPEDPDRDTFHGTRFEDPPKDPRHPNKLLTGGLYGLRWKPNCTQSYRPYFQGMPDAGRICPDCAPVHPAFRVLAGWTHSFRPVNYYYAGGSWVPIYDLDPWAIGPGTYPYPFIQNPNKGG